MKYIFAVFLLSINHCAIAQSSDESDLEIAYTDGLIDLKADNTPLNTVLDALANETGIETNYLISTDTLPTVSITLTNVSLRQCLDYLLNNINHMTYYDADSSNLKKQPAQIWVLGTDENQPALSLVEQPGFLALGDKQRSEMLLYFVNKKALTDTELIDALAISLKTDHNALVRTRAALGLTKLSNPKSVSALIEALSDENQSVRSQVILALAKVGNDEAVNALGDLLSENTDSIDRTMVVRALRNLDSDTARHFLGLAAHDADSQVRESIIPDKSSKARTLNTKVNGLNTQ